MLGLSESILDNLKFLISEVDSQVSSLYENFKTPSHYTAIHILDRIGYAHNLKLQIHSSCLELLSEGDPGDTLKLRIRAIEMVATDVERIAELCRDCVKHISYLDDWALLDSSSCKRMLKRVRVGLDRLGSALESNDTQQALKIGLLEGKLDKDYRKQRQYYIRQLSRSDESEDLVTALYIAHCIEQMGDELLHISESIISANLGQSLSIERFHTLQETIAKLENHNDAIKMKPIAETRSGSAISGIASADSKDESYIAIFKDGVKKKVKEEREGVESWHEIYPGLAPRILNYKKRGRSAAMLVEHLEGYTFEQIVLHDSAELLEDALKHLSKTLNSIWKETSIKGEVSADYMGQLEARLPDIYRVHPEFALGESCLCECRIPGFDQLLADLKEQEKSLPAPFSVYIHGDFNLDNVIYDPDQKRINFIDLHRSTYTDYVQDVSVFMVSSYRLQVLEKSLRLKIMKLARDFFRHSRVYAKRRGDKTFQIRLALGLARSFATSTRFILDKSLSRAMFYRSRYIMERVVETDLKQADSFKLPIEDIFSV